MFVAIFLLAKVGDVHLGRVHKHLMNVHPVWRSAGTKDLMSHFPSRITLDIFRCLSDMVDPSTLLHCSFLVFIITLHGIFVSHFHIKSFTFMDF